MILLNGDLMVVDKDYVGDRDFHSILAMGAFYLSIFVPKNYSFNR